MLTKTNSDILEGNVTPIHSLLHWEETQPNKVYFTQPFPDGSIIEYTWKQVADQVKRMAAYIQSFNLPEQSHIGIYGKNSAHWIMADLAIWMSGNVTVPLYPTLNAESSSYVLDHSETKLLFIGKLDGVTDSWNQVKDIIPADLPCVRAPMSPDCDAKPWDEIIKETEPLAQVPLPNPNTLATIVYTSGSTGRPKGVMHNFNTMMQVSKRFEQLFQLTQDERQLSYLPLAHALERVLVETTSLYLGYHVYFANNLDTFMTDLGRARPTIFVSVPRLWTKFQHGVNEKMSPRLQKILMSIPIVGNIVRKKILKQLGLSHVRLAATGSAPLPNATISWYHNLGLELLEGYAMTENFAYSHANRLGENRPGYVGFAQEGVECKLSDEGEILVKSPGNMLGYYKDPVQTEEAMTADGFLKTGDLGEITADGCLKLTGRVKDIFKTAKGKYVAPVPIELKLGESPLLEVVCVGGANLPQPIALVILVEDIRRNLKQGGDKENINAMLETLLIETNKKLDPHEKLDYFVVVTEPWTMESGLLTPTMKIQRQKIEDHYVGQYEAWEKQKSPVIWS